MTEPLNKEQMKAKKNKEAVAAMRSAKDNMEAALSRISDLERCAISFDRLVDDMLKHVSVNTYPYEGRTTYSDSFAKRKSDLIAQV